MFVVLFRDDSPAFQVIVVLRLGRVFSQLHFGEFKLNQVTRLLPKLVVLEFFPVNSLNRIFFEKFTDQVVKICREISHLWSRVFNDHFDKGFQA